MTVPPTTGNVGRSGGPLSWISRISLSIRVVTPWRRRKTKDNYRPLGDAPSEAHTTHRSTRPFPLPYEIEEMIIAHLSRDFRTLIACSLTCRSWYTAAVPHLHHTLTLRGNTPEVGRSKLEPLSKLRELGLAPLVKEVRVYQYHCENAWIAPWGSSNHTFSGFANVQTLRLEEPDIQLFIPGTERYFKHLPPTLRSITLCNPRCTPQQLSRFLSLFPNLDDIEIEGYRYIPGGAIPVTELVPFSASKLRGRLVLHDFPRAETWTDLITSRGGLRFRFMDLCGSANCAPVLFEACAKTLDTLRFSVIDGSFARSVSFSQLNLSRLEVLRSLEVRDWLADFRPADHHRIGVAEMFSTITSPVFSELVVVLEIDTMACLSKAVTFFETLRVMNEVRPFRLVFLLEVSDFFQGARWELEKDLDLLAAKGSLNFLDSLPTIR